MIEEIRARNKTHTVTDEELQALVAKAKEIFSTHHSNAVWFERSVFINWTCAIADCKYCYLSTKPRLQKDALRSKESILAELILCKAMGWRIGYLTGGLRVEPNAYMQELLQLCEKTTGEKIRMNFGPYNRTEIDAFGPYVSGIGSAIESFDEALHNYICPSKPLKTLMHMLSVCKEKNIPTFITIILGLGERKSDVAEVIAKIKEYNISMVQLCFLKPQDNTVFSEVPPPDTKYMAWWVASLRIAHPSLIIKIALVEERMHEMSLLLDAGANCFSRFMIFKEFGTQFSEAIISECAKAGRTLEGTWDVAPNIDCTQVVNATNLPEDIKPAVVTKLEQYVAKLQKI